MDVADRSVSPRPYAKRVSLVLGALVLSLLTVEAIARVLVWRRSHAAKTYRTTPLPTFWTDSNRAFGVWHPANTTFHHVEQCWDVTYHSNSYGARDVERAQRSPLTQRHIVLGDSFVEGYAVPDGERMTERLNASTNEEFLNFGTGGGFGTVQELMLYRTLAVSFDHSDVLLFVLPNNDFSDNDPRYFLPSRYRPYLRLTDQGHQIYYTVRFEDRDLNLMGPTMVGWNWISNSVYLLNLPRQAIERRMRRKIEPSYTSYAEHNDREIEMMAAAIRDLATAARPRPVHIFMIPLQVDLDGYITRGNQYPLASQLRTVLQDVAAVNVVDLLPDFVQYMHAHRVSASSFYLACDAHWSSFGNAVAAEAIERHLAIHRRRALSDLSR